MKISSWNERKRFYRVETKEILNKRFQNTPKIKKFLKQTFEHQYVRCKFVFTNFAKTDFTPGIFTLSEIFSKKVGVKQAILRCVFNKIFFGKSLLGAGSRGFLNFETKNPKKFEESFFLSVFGKLTPDILILKHSIFVFEWSCVSLLGVISIFQPSIYSIRGGHLVVLSDFADPQTLGDHST